jgi:hypothetical protein
MARNLDNIDCPKCKNDLKVSALKCPTCGAEFTKAEADARTKEHWRSLGTGCLFLIFIAAALWWAFLKGDDKKVVEQQDAVAVPNEAPKESAKPEKHVTTEELAQRFAINTGGNEQSRQLLAMSEHDRANTLSTLAGCTATGKAMFMGAEAGADFWSVGCSEGDVMVSLPADLSKTRILECSLLPKINLSCWSMLESKK